jgi:hypothetical protein
MNVAQAITVPSSLQCIVGPGTTESSALFATPAFWSALFALISSGAAVMSWYINRRNLDAKLMDRVYEIHKLVVGNPASFGIFLTSKTWDDPAFYGDGDTHSTDYYRGRSFAFLFLNLFDETCSMYSGEIRRVKTTSPWRGWRQFVIEGAKHPLIQVIILEECEPTLSGGLASKATSNYCHGVLPFLCANIGEWRNQKFDTKVFW